MNPYDWQSHDPEVAIPRPEVEKIAARLRRGGSAVVLGGRGMGKSVFLRQLCRTLEAPGLRALSVPGPPSALTVDACLEQLARVLGVSGEGALGTAELVDAYFARDDVPERLVLLFDEFDRYAEAGGQVSANPPGRGFFNDLELTRRGRRALGVLATGSIGVYAFRDVLGSSFLSRAEHWRLGPFDRPTVGELAWPFVERGQALEEGVVESLVLASGGIPALLTYGLEELWELPHAPVERDVTAAFVRFQQRNRGYLADVRRAFSDPRLSRAPQRVWELVLQSPGELLRETLEDACRVPGDGLDLDLVDVLELLQAAGLIRVEGSVFADDPVRAHPIPSLLNLPTAAPPGKPLREQLVHDLTILLAKLHRASMDFFRPGREGAPKRLVPEAVFAAHLALGFELMGWRTEREAQSAAGRTDLKLRRNGGEEVAVVEIKIWGRPGAKEAHRQLERYWTSEVTAGVVVQLTDAELPDWPEVYRRECLKEQGITAEAVPVGSTPLRARFAVTSTTADGLAAGIDHLLLRRPRRALPQGGKGKPR